MNRIAQALSKAFDRHRIIFWYDVKKELRSEFEKLDLAVIEKIELSNNEFCQPATGVASICSPRIKCVDGCRATDTR